MAIDIEASGLEPAAVQAAVLSFWYGDPPDYASPRKVWFKRDEAFDTAVATRFSSVYAAAARGDLDGMAASPLGALVLVIVLDQFPRNMFRGQPAAFATDGKARTIADAALARGFDRDMTVVQKLFLYLPFEHSEDLADQDRCCDLIAATGDADFLDYAVRHRDIVARFGRFPHRNAVLGRVSTPEEEAFLAQPGSSF